MLDMIDGVYDFGGNKNDSRDIRREEQPRRRQEEPRRNRRVADSDVF